jgi:hypothetical protein
MARLVLGVLALAAVGFLAGCPSPSPAPVAPVAAAAPNPIARVVTLEPDARTAIIAGPLMLSSINPGSDLELALVPGDTCGGDETWFAYSGSGVAVPSGQILCARSRAAQRVTHAFSGR